MHCSAGAALTQVLGGLDLQEVVSQSEGWTSASRVWPGLSEASLLGSRQLPSACSRVVFALCTHSLLPGHSLLPSPVGLGPTP